MHKQNVHHQNCMQLQFNSLGYLFQLKRFFIRLSPTPVAAPIPTRLLFWFLMARKRYRSSIAYTKILFFNWNFEFGVIRKWTVIILVPHIVDAGKVINRSWEWIEFRWSIFAYEKRVEIVTSHNNTSVHWCDDSMGKQRIIIIIFLSVKYYYKSHTLSAQNQQNKITIKITIQASNGIGALARVSLFQPMEIC